MTSRSFHAQQQRKIKHQTFEISHPAIGTVRYVGGQFYDKTLTLKTGEQLVYNPISMKVGLPNMGEFNTLSMKIEIGAAGTQVKKKLKLIDAYNLNSPSTTVTPFVYREFLDGVEIGSFSMWVKEFVFNDRNVAILASDDNPSAISVAEIYTESRFPGVAVLS